ncbi:MAG: preprotein translocase subunit SecE [Candidatus Cloacimonetes bacterium]|nr:preprotein translocase subunit SecE [Candidatus Cloacimonadota bacterium]
MFKKMFQFFKDVRQEMRYVNWPSKDDLKEGTTVVIIMSSITAVFLSVVDWTFSMLMRFLVFR